MYKALAVLRTLFLLFITGFTLLTAPVEVWGKATVAVSIDSLRRLNRAAWIAIAWIAFETVIAWIAIRFRRTPARAAPVPPAPREPSGTPSP
jgi:hypothetical protein